MMKIVRKIITVILLFVIGLSLFNLYDIYKTDADEEKALQKINEIVVPANKTKKALIKDDIMKMKEINSDIIGYLKFDTELIKEPVAQTTNNFYYLNHDVNRNYNSFGTIFMNKDNDMNSTNLVLYGHAGVYANTKKKFSNLNLLLNDNQKTQENCYFNFYTENEIRRYQISYVLKNGNQEIFNHQTLNFNNEEEFNTWITYAKNHNTVTCTNEIKYGDKFMTLQTCLHGGGPSKVIVIAKEIERKSY